MSLLDHDDFDAYLARLRVEREPPSVDALTRLHSAHVEHVPYETSWIHLGERWNVDPAASLRRVAHNGRGGYCFHLNGAFSELLRELGYSVSRHVGGVHGPEGPAETAMTNHLVLTVSELPSDANTGGVWYVDAGLGDALHEPLPLIEGTYVQGPFTVVLERTDAIGDWRLRHDPRGSFPGMVFREASADIGEFASRNEYLSTSPESGFVKLMTVQRRDGTGVDILRELSVTRIDADDARCADWTIGSERELFEVLADLFGLTLTDVDDQARNDLWHHLRTGHEAWLEAQTTGSSAAGSVST